MKLTDIKLCNKHSQSAVLEEIAKCFSDKVHGHAKPCTPSCLCLAPSSMSVTAKSSFYTFSYYVKLALILKTTHWF